MAGDTYNITYHIGADTSSANKNLDETGKKVEEVGKKAEGTKKGFGAMGTAVKGVGTALKAAGIGLVLAAIAALFNLLKENQAVMDWLNKATKTMAILFNQLVGVIGGPVKDIFTGFFSMMAGGFKATVNWVMGAALAVKGIFDDEAKAKSQAYFDAAKKNAQETADGFKLMADGIVDLTVKVYEGASGIGDAYDKASAAADNFIKRQEQLKINEAELNKFIAGNRLELEQLKGVREDETKSIEERIAASDRMMELIQEEEDRAIRLQQEKIALMKADLALTQTTNDDLVAIANAEAELDNLRTNAAVRNTENMKFANGLRKRIADKAAVEEAERRKTRSDEIDAEIQADIDRYDAFLLRKAELTKEWALEDAETDQEFYELKLEQEQERFDALLENKMLTAEEIELLEEEHQRKMAEIKGEADRVEKKADDDKLQKKLKDIGQVLDFAKKSMDVYSAVLDQQMNKELKAAEGNAAKQDQIRKEYGEKKKRAAIISAIIDTAMGVVKAIAQNPPPSPIGIISGVLVAAMGAVQIAAISQQQFAKGGIISGPKHAQGGIATPFGELEGGEGIINAASMSNPSLRNIASIANTTGGGEDFSTGDGSISLSSASISAIVGGINNKKVYVSETDITSTQNRVEAIETEATL